MTIENNDEARESVDTTVEHSVESSQPTTEPTERLSRRERARLKREANVSSNEQVESIESDSDFDGIGDRTKTIPEPSIKDRIFSSVNTGKSDTRKSEDKPRKKFDAKKRKKEATELAPFLDSALAMYAGMAHGVPVNPAMMSVPYWYESSDGSLNWVKGTPGQAIAFHALGSVNATVTKLDEWMDRHRDLIGLLIAGGFVAAFDVHCRMVAESTRNASQGTSERQQSASTQPPAEPSVTRVVIDGDSVHSEPFK